MCILYIKEVLTIEQNRRYKKFYRDNLFSVFLVLFSTLIFVVFVIRDKQLEIGNEKLTINQEEQEVGDDAEVKGMGIQESCATCYVNDWPVDCTACNYGYFLINGKCCPNDMSHCNPPCTPATPANYQVASNDCSTTINYCNNTPVGYGCGTESATFYKVKFNLTILPNGGTCSLQNTQICHATANPAPECTRSGYSLSYNQTGCGGTFNTTTGVCSSITQATTIGANWTLTNQAPTAPTSLLTNNSTNPVGISPYPYFSAIFNDPNTGDTGVHYQIQVNTNSSFTGTTMWNSTKTAMTATAIGSRSPNINYAGTTLTQNGAKYYWRIKFWDNNGGDSPWSAVANFTMNTAPAAPTAPLTNGLTNPVGVTTSPYFSAIYHDSDSGDNGVFYQIQVDTNPSFTGTTMWDSAKTTMTSTANGSRSPNITYSGIALPLNGSTYYWRIRFWDSRGSYSPWSSTALFTMTQGPSAPTLLRTNGLTNPINVVPSPAPYFSAIFNHPDTSRTALHYQIVMTLEGELTYTFWDSGKQPMSATAAGTRSPNITYSGPSLNHNGLIYRWVIYFWDDLGIKSSVSSMAEFTMNQSPTATALLTEGQTNPVGVTNLTPKFSAIFNDTSGNYGNYYQIQVNSQNDFNGVTMWNTGKTAMTSVAAGVRIPDKTYAGTTLSHDGATYYWRIKFWDTYGAEGEWSTVNRFTMYKQGLTVTISTTGTQTTPMYIDDDIETLSYMGGAFSFTSSFNNPMGVVPGLTSVTLYHTGINGSTAITQVQLMWSYAPTGESCRSEIPLDAEVYRWIANPFQVRNPVAISGIAPAPKISIGAELCMYVLFSFNKSSLSHGNSLDFSITDFAVAGVQTKLGLPANIAGITTFQDPPIPPSFTEMSNNGPKNPGSAISFTANAEDADGKNLKLVVCKTAGLDGEECDGGESDTYCESTLTPSYPSCTWDIPTVYPDGSYNAYPYIFNSEGIASEDALQGAAHTFGVNNVAPTIPNVGIIGIPLDNTIRLVTDDTKEVKISTTISDNNGCANNEIASVKAYFYRSGVGYSSCSQSAHSNPNNCYPEISCTLNTGSCSGASQTHTCTTNLVHYADSTETGSPFDAQDWVVTIKAIDNGLGTAGTNPQTTLKHVGGFHVGNLLAFSVTPSLDYGIKEVNQSSMGSQITVTSGGNIAQNHSLWGEDMCQDYPICNNYSIEVGAQRYATSSSINYENATPLAYNPTPVYTNLAKQTTSTPTTVSIWWGIKVPLGTPVGGYDGMNWLTSSIAY